MLQMGSSKPWPDAMEVLTGQREMDATGLVDYFKPLADWLEKNNKQFGEEVGWEPSKKRKYDLLTKRVTELAKSLCFWMNSHVIVPGKAQITHAHYKTHNECSNAI
jgi:hypothetical protein